MGHILDRFLCYHCNNSALVLPRSSMIYPDKFLYKSDPGLEHIEQLDLKGEEELISLW